MSSPDCAGDEVWAWWPVRARRKVERGESRRHEGIHGGVCEGHTGTAASAEAEYERVRVQGTLSAQEALGVERTWVLVYLWVIRDLP